MSEMRRSSILAAQRSPRQDCVPRHARIRRFARYALIATAVLFLALFLLAPLAIVFAEAFEQRGRRLSCEPSASPTRARRSV